jgi:hypothetical protein
MSEDTGSPVSENTSSRQFVIRGPHLLERCTLAVIVEVPYCRRLLGNRCFGQKVGLAMKAIMIGYWVLRVVLTFIAHPMERRTKPLELVRFGE